MKIELHDYQKECLDDLRLFFDEAAKINDPQIAFRNITDYVYGRYQPAPKMEDSMPYVCIRLPTGGGKTLLAAHAIGIAAKRYSQTDAPVCLWLAPSNAIVQQTLKALKTPGHPCRIALTDAFSGRDVNCISVSEALRISRVNLESSVTVIVATIQSLRQEETEGRKIYDDNGNLMEHFDSVDPELKGNLRRGDGGKIYYSLDNALKLRRPIIISDEAHNAGTDLSYESLARFSPSCIVEFTATPQTAHDPPKGKYASNVLTQASAFQLKNANMIKFPLHLEIFNNNPREAIRAAIVKRKDLEEIAKKEKEYIRPITLYQAEDRKGETTVEDIENWLKDKKLFGVPQEQIAVQTGNRRELEEHDLMSPDCPIRHIITVRAIAEGWDCPFAYVLCSMANYESPRPVEQVLGRILRLPYASRKKDNSLNESYAYVARGRFREVASSVITALVNKNGYQLMEGADLVRSSSSNIGGLFGKTSESTNKSKEIVVPRLMVNGKDEQQPLEFEHFLDVQWSIAQKIPEVDDFQLPASALGKADIDINEKQELTYKMTATEEIRRQMTLLDSDKKWTEESLAAFIDSEIKHLDIPQMQSVPYILSTIKALREKYDLALLARYRFDVRRYIEEKIKDLRNEKARQGYQQILETVNVNNGKLQVSASHTLNFERGKNYQPRSHYDGDSFKKHLHPYVGDLKNIGEEYECACYLDDLEEMDVWVRNLDKDPDYSFWLQTSTDKFYPDFVCRLKDGRILVVEYKGGDRWSNDDSKEKRAIGKIWAELSGGTCLFIMPNGTNYRNEIPKLLSEQS